MSPLDEPSIPPPQQVRHLSTLWWWLGLAGALLAVHLAPRWPTPAAATATPAAHRARAAVLTPGDQDFLALMLGKVGNGSPDALPPEALRAQLEQLKAAGAHAVRIEDVQAFLHGERALPPKAVLIAFDEAGRETIDAADPLLAALGWPALAFVSVEGVAAANLNLVSRRRLEQMAQSGRWSIGLNACRKGAVDFDAAAYRQGAAELQSWAGQPVLAAGCNGSVGAADAPARWSTALMQASLPLGFVAHPTGVNRRGDSPWLLHFARIGPGNRGADALVRRAGALAPREQPFVDEFDSATLDAGWVVDSGSARVADGALRLGAAPGDTGVLTLAGSARWQDARLQVDLEAAPAGQFWIYARYTGQKSFVRLGTVGRQVVLQRSDVNGGTRQLGASAAPRGRMRLTLSVIGDRAIAAIDDRPLLERPVDLPADLVEGPASLVVWGGGQRTAARISRVDIEPLARRVALLPAHPGEGSFERLRQLADELWAVSPRRFRWQAGTGTDEATDAAVEILAGMHRVAMMPAVSVAQLPAGQEWNKLRAQMLAWADRPQFAGLNLVLERVEPDDFARIGELRGAFAAVGKQLVVTSPDDTGDLETPHELAWFIGPRSSGFVLATSSPQRVSG